MEHTKETGINILIVDDEPMNIDILSNALSPHYNLMAVTSGKKAISSVDKNPPNVILLDVLMPDMNGFEVCRQIKSQPQYNDIEVIFVSALNSPNDIVAGYEAGGSDFLSKPILPEELLRKVKLAAENRAQRIAMKSEKADAERTAMTAITSAGEQGVLLDFMRRSFTVTSENQLAKLIVNSLKDYGLESSVQIRTKSNTTNISSEGVVPPLEKEFLTKVSSLGRLKEKDNYFVANFGDITLLVKNMPGDDVDKRGRLRDHLAILLEGAETRLNVLALDITLSSALDSIKKLITNLQKIQLENKKKSIEIFDHVMQDLESSFLSYGLTEEQENLLLEVVQRGSDKMIENLDYWKYIDEQFSKVITILKSSLIQRADSGNNPS